MAQVIPLVLNAASGGYKQMQAGDFIGIANGGTGATTASAALANLGGITSLNTVFTGVIGETLSTGATTDRPSSPSTPIIRYNSTLGQVEVYNPSLSVWSRVDNNRLQTVRDTIPVTTGTTQIPFGNAAPLSTGGTQLYSKTITPMVVGSTINIRFAGMVDNSVVTGTVTVALFKGTTLIAFMSIGTTSYNGNRPAPVVFDYNDTTTSTAAITYSIRIGLDSAGTWYFGRPAASTMGGGLPVSITFTEEL